MNQIRGKERPVAIQQHIEDLSSQDKEVRKEARRSLAIMGEPSIKPLTEALKTKGMDVRWEIVKILTEMHNPEAASILVRELEDENPDIRWIAAKGLIALGHKGLLPLLSLLISKPDSLWLRMGAHHILSDLYIGEVHENEDGYLIIYRLNNYLKEAIRPVIIAIESMDHNILLPGAANKALAIVKSSADS